MSPLGYEINSYIWCFAGGLVGWAAGFLMGTTGRTEVVENVLVGVFGAFIGGEFIVSMLDGPVKVVDTSFHIRSLAIALGAAAFMLIILKLMRRVVGPLRSGKPKPRRN